MDAIPTRPPPSKRGKSIPSAHSPGNPADFGHVSSDMHRRLLRLVPVALALGAATAQGMELKVRLPDDATPAARASAGKVVAAMLTGEQRIAEILGVPAEKRPKNWEISFERMPGVAAASGASIHFSLDHMERNPDDAVGVGIHELTHVVQGYGSNYRGDNVWITEGMADYVRFGVFANGRYETPHDPQRQNYNSGYRVTGRFLGWCEGRHPGLVKALHAALSSGKEGVPVWEARCGARLPALWKKFCEEQAAASKK